MAEPTARQIDIAEDLYFATKITADAEGGWVNGWDNQSLDKITVDSKVDFVTLARVCEKHIERALAEQREEIASAIHETRQPGDYFITHQHVQIARNFGQVDA